MRSTSHKCLIKSRQSDQKDIPGIHQKIEPSARRTVKTKLVSFELKYQISVQSGSAPDLAGTLTGKTRNMTSTAYFVQFLVNFSLFLLGIFQRHFWCAIISNSMQRKSAHTLELIFDFLSFESCACSPLFTVFVKRCIKGRFDGGLSKLSSRLSLT